MMLEMLGETLCLDDVVLKDEMTQTLGSHVICCNPFLGPHIKNNKNNKIQKNILSQKKTRKTVPF